MSNKTTLPDRLGLIRTAGPVVGAAGVAAALVLSFAFGNRELFFHATFYSFWILNGLCLGSMAFILIHHLTAGSWSFVAQRVFEAFTRTLPIPAVMFLIVYLGTVLGGHHMYDAWVHPDSHTVKLKLEYLNIPFWTARAVFYFAVWFTIIHFFNKWSRELETTGNALITLKFRTWAPFGLIAYCLTMTFAAVDWGQSIEPEWFSTMYAPLTWISQGLTTFAVTTLLLAQLQHQKPLSRYIHVDHFHIYGTFMCGFIVLWTYMSFSQFLIIWSGNLPEEIHYYLDRSNNQLYRAIILILMLGHFLLPFMVLLQRRIKRNVTTLCWVAFWVLAMRLVDIFFWFVPAFHHGDTSVPWRDMIVYACALVGFGGIFFWYFLGQLTKLPLLALNDPRLYEALSPGHGHGAGEEVADHA